MKTITIGQQTTLEGATFPIRRNVFDRPIDELRDLVEAARVECAECGAFGRPGRRMIAFEVYDTPWETEPRTRYACRTAGDFGLGLGKRVCADLLTDTGWADFRYFECDGCGRMICEQNPHNGWHVQFRMIGADRDQVCLRCYQRRILAMGIDWTATTTLPGMFFSGDNREPLDAGFEEIEESVFVGSQSAVDEVIAKCRDLQRDGHDAILGYERMGIGGGEGCVTIFARARRPANLYAILDAIESGDSPPEPVYSGAAVA